MTYDNAPQLDSVGFEEARNCPRVPRFSAGKPSTVQIAQADIATSVITMLFGAVHCFAWSFHFPSETEQLLWRIASLTTTASPVVWAALFAKFLMSDVDVVTDVLSILAFIAVPIYLVARAMMLVLAMLGLRSLSSAAYETVYWTTFIPHV